MKLEPEIAGCSIVLIGQFNPAIFQPAWLTKNSILPSDAQIELIHPELSIVRLGDISINVELGRFTIECQSDPWIRIADVVSKTFGEYLTHTPIGVGGINLNYHFRTESVSKRTEWGRLLAPLEPWGEWGARLAHAVPGQDNGVRIITMLENWDTDDLAGHWQVQIEPSKQIKDNTGVYFGINHEFRQKIPSEGSVWVSEYIQTRFEQIVSETKWIVEQIQSKRPS